MKYKINIKERKPIWIALSELYLDTELQDSDLKHIAEVILESPYSLDEVKDINKYEVFPVLKSNLLSIAGEWSGFDEEWLVHRITDLLGKRNIGNKIAIESTFFIYKSRQKKEWQELEKIYNSLRTHTF